MVKLVFKVSVDTFGFVIRIIGNKSSKSYWFFCEVLLFVLVGIVVLGLFGGGGVLLLKWILFGVFVWCFGVCASKFTSFEFWRVKGGYDGFDFFDVFSFGGGMSLFIFFCFFLLRVGKFFFFMLKFCWGFEKSYTFSYFSFGMFSYSFLKDGFCCGILLLFNVGNLELLNLGVFWFCLKLFNLFIILFDGFMFNFFTFCIFGISFTFFCDLIVGYVCGSGLEFIIFFVLGVFMFVFGIGNLFVVRWICGIFCFCTGWFALRFSIIFCCMLFMMLFILFCVIEFCFFVLDVFIMFGCCCVFGIFSYGSGSEFCRVVSFIISRGIVGVFCIFGGFCIGCCCVNCFFGCGIVLYGIFGSFFCCSYGFGGGAVFCGSYSLFCIVVCLMWWFFDVLFDVVFIVV